MSEKAVKFVQSLDAKYFVTKHLLISIARNTSNKTCKCECGVKGLVDDTGLSKRTITRHLGNLKKLNLITMTRRPVEGYGSKKSDIEIVGFRDWLQKQVRGKTAPRECTQIDNFGALPPDDATRHCGTTIHDILSIHDSNTCKLQHGSTHGTSHVKHERTHGTTHDREHTSSDRDNVTIMEDTWGGEARTTAASTTRVLPLDPVSEDDWHSLCLAGDGDA